jgi:hypothetical protein
MVKETTPRGRRDVNRIVDELAWAQVETESTITIDVTLTPAQLVALSNTSIGRLRRTSPKLTSTAMNSTLSRRCKTYR